LRSAQGTLIVTGDENAVRAVAAILNERGLTPHASQRRNLDAAVVTSWLVAATLLVKTAPDVLRALAALREIRLDRVELDLDARNIVIDNPRPGQVGELAEKLERDARGGNA
jgi:hypothetical protein